MDSLIYYLYNSVCENLDKTGFTEIEKLELDDNFGFKDSWS